MIIAAIWRICSGMPSWISSPSFVMTFPDSLAAVRRVSTNPNAMAFTLILNCPHSFASVFVRPTTAALPAL
jgi:hypothetical protein